MRNEIQSAVHAKQLLEFHGPHSSTSGGRTQQVNGYAGQRVSLHKSATLAGRTSRLLAQSLPSAPEDVATLRVGEQQKSVRESLRQSLQSSGAKLDSTVSGRRLKEWRPIHASHQLPSQDTTSQGNFLG